MIALLKNYQTLFVGIIGFLGVIATLAFNARLVRKAEIRKLAHDARVLRTALVEEMKLQRDALVYSAASSKIANEDNLTETKKSDALIPLRRLDDIFVKSIEKLGLLMPDEVEAVLDAYLSLKDLTPKLRLIELRIPPERRRVEYGQAPPESYALVANEDMPVAAELHSLYAPAFDKAIEKLSWHLKQTSP